MTAPTQDNEPRRSEGRNVVAVAVAQFAGLGLAALIIVALATSVASRRVGEREAIANARTVTVLKAQTLIEPLITPALREMRPSAVAAVDRVVRRDVLDDSLVRVKIWTADRRVVYSDQTELIGTLHELAPEEIDAFETGRIEAEVSDLTDEENRFERQFDTLLEVYLPVTGTDPQPMMFEAYYRYDLVEENADQLWRSLAPIALGALVILQLLQIPLAWRLARRLRDRLREQERLTWRALEASDVERRQIAADLHDGVVQDLTGVGYALSASARQPVEPAVATELEASAATVRRAVGDLRSLIVDLSPAGVHETGLGPALDDLVRRTAPSGLTVGVEWPDGPFEVPPATARVLYRAAQEGLRNVARHAGAATARLTVRRDGLLVRLEVADDGVGFDPATLTARAAEGHLGVRALTGLVGDAGGRVEVRSAPGAGTTLTVEVPVG